MLNNSYSLNSSSIDIKNVNLWAHVGVLEKERLYGQHFLLNFTIWIDLEDAAKNDNLSFSVDYSVAIKNIQNLSFQISCQTIECFSEKILDILESLYGELPMAITLTKCSPPVDGFTGSVSINRVRNRS